MENPVSENEKELNAINEELKKGEALRQKALDLRNELKEKKLSDEQIKATLRGTKDLNLSEEEIDKIMTEVTGEDKKEPAKEPEKKKVTQEDVDKIKARLDEINKKIAAKLVEIDAEKDPEKKKNLESQKDELNVERDAILAEAKTLQKLAKEQEGEEENPNQTPEQKEGAKATLEQDRNAYVAENAKHLKELRKAGRVNWLRKTFWLKPNEMPKTPEKLTELKSKYEKSLYAYGNELYANKEISLKQENPDITPAELKTKMEQFKAEVIFKQLVVDEEALLQKKNVEAMTPKEKGVMRQMMDWYGKLSPAKRRLYGILLSTAVGGTIAVTTGGVGILGAYLGSKLGRTAISVAASETVASGIRRVHEPYIKDQLATGTEHSKEMLTKMGWSEDSFKTAQAGYQKTLSEYNNRMASMRKKQMIGRILTGAIVGYGIGHTDMFQHPTPVPSPIPHEPPVPTPPQTGFDPNAIVTGEPGHTGITWALKAQLEGHDDWAQSMADKMGYHGDIHSADFYSKLGQKFGYIDSNGNEVRVATKGTAYLLDHENFKVTEYEAGDHIHGKEVHAFGQNFEDKSMQDKYEYNWDKTKVNLEDGNHGQNVEVKVGTEKLNIDNKPSSENIDNNLNHNNPENTTNTDNEHIDDDGSSEDKTEEFNKWRKSGKQTTNTENTSTNETETTVGEKTRNWRLDEYNADRKIGKVQRFLNWLGF